MVDDIHLANIVEIAEVLESDSISILPTQIAQRERHVKLANIFNGKMMNVFEKMIETNVYRKDSFYIFMESLCKFYFKF
jgi:hypothetical protein